MLAHTISASLRGIDAFEVRVEADIAAGLPHLFMVGLPGAAVQESRERVRAALQNAGLPFPMRRVVVNLAPADVRKEGPAFDLPIALALLLAQRLLPPDSLAETLCIGELALDGSLRPVRGAVSVGLLAHTAKLRRVIAPPGNGPEIAAVSRVEVITPHTLAATVGYLRGTVALARAEVPPIGPVSPPPELSEVRGQAAAKRALEVSAAGGHNLLMTGPPGSGKTMLAARLQGLLPNLTRPEAIEATRIHSVAGSPITGLLTRPPFRRPHHTVSYAGMVGGGNIPGPGEASLAHNGALFLDEISEYGRASLEALRQPLEDGVVTISRVRGSLTFPARFLLIATRNPCPCGFHGDPERACVCSPALLRQYRNRISGPLLDRIDIRITVPRLIPEDLLASPSGPDTRTLAARVLSARRIALARQGSINGRLPASELRRHCSLDATCEAFARHVIRKLGITGRGFERLLRVARTISDLSGSERIREEHLAEGAAYRETTL